MSSTERSALRLSIKTFYDLHHEKGKFYTFLHFNDYGLRIKACVKKIDVYIIVRMFENLKPKVHEANRNGLSSLIQ